MRRKVAGIDKAAHRRVAGELFNHTWSLLGQRQRSKEEDDEMIHSAHASRYHWGIAGSALNRSIGEWQISRVYAVLGRSEPALYHGRRSLEIATRNRLARFYVAYAYEALARAWASAGNGPQRDKFLKKARKLGEAVRDADDRRMLLEDLATIL